MVDLGQALQIIETACRGLDKEPEKTFGLGRQEDFAAVRRELLVLCEGVKHHPALEPGLDLEPLRGLFQNPLVVNALILGLTKETLSFANLTCSQYAQIKTERPLTDEEKQVGGALAEVLEALKQLIVRLGPEGEAREP